MKLVPSAAALAVKDNQVLLVREEEASGHITGKYGLPGGHVDEGESEIVTATREFCEETGLTATEKDFEAFPGNYFEADIPRKDGSIVHFGWRVFHCKNFSGELRSSKQTTPQWIDFDEARKMQKEGKLHANTLEVLENYLKFISN